MPTMECINPMNIGVDWGTLARSCSVNIQNQNKIFKYIADYNYIPNKFNFLRVDNEEELFLGVELEIDCGGTSDDNAKKVVDILGKDKVYCKRDGSLQNGFEIVSHPCTYEYHKTMPYELLFEELTKLGYKSHDIGTCGMHVHINRDYFGKDKLSQDLNIGKLLYLFEKFWDKIVLIARRGSNQYAQRFYLNDNETIFDMYAKSKNSNKYGVINLQHKDTVEIRIFKGTLNYRTFMVTLEFVKTMAQIVKNIDIYDIQYITWDSILNQLSSELVLYIEEREIIKKEEKKEQKIDNTNFYQNYYSSFQSSRMHIFPQHTFEVNWDTPDSPIQRETNNEPVLFENMNIEQLKKKIKEIENLVRRSRNPMEQTNLRREIQKYANRIGVLRRRA